MEGLGRAHCKAIERFYLVDEGNRCSNKLQGQQEQAKGKSESKNSKAKGNVLQRKQGWFV